MKRFKIDFPINGQDTPLYVEAMDDTHTRYAIEREENDPRPLLLEHAHDNLWHIKSQDTWSLTEDEINELGCKINNECEVSAPVFSGINAK